MVEINIEYHSDDRSYEASENNLEIKKFDVWATDDGNDVEFFVIRCDGGSVYFSKAEIIKIVKYWNCVEKDIQR